MSPKGETDLLAYPTGSKILINELDITTGGGGTNTAVALAKLGHKVAWLGKLGDDSNADTITNKLKKENISSLAVKGKGYSGYSIILDSIEHDRTILAYKGVNNDLSFNELPLKKLKTKWFYFSSMLESSFRTQEKLAEFAKKKGIKIAFNASSYLAKKGAGYLKNILRKTEIFILNKEEAQYLVKGSSIKELLKGLRKLGPKIAIITDGKKGAHAFDGKDMYTIKTTNIKVIETTGAGDAFAASLLSGMIKKNDIKFAMQLGQANSESVIQYHGAKNKLLKYKEALKLIKKNHSIVKKEKL
jgi:ribokinase